LFYDLIIKYHKMESREITFHPTDTKSLCDGRIQSIYQIEQDMWAREEWLWEYLACTSCSHVFSKQDIFKWQVEPKRYFATVHELEQEESRDIFCCMHCSGRLEHVFPQEEYISSMRDRYSSRATLLLMQKWDELIWFMDWYVDDFDTIYERELSDHYAGVWIDRVKELVKATLQSDIPKDFFSCSSSWTRERYMNMIHIYNLLQKFFENFPEEMLWVTALSELHAGWPYTRIFSSLWARSTGVRDIFWSEIQTTQTYDSDIYVHENFWQKCRDAFSGVERKDFLRNIRI